MHSFSAAAAIAALAALPAVSAHGYVANVVVDGESYEGANPNWTYQPEKPKRAGWYAENQDNGFVSPDSYSDPDIICHKGATPGTMAIPVKAGSKIDLQWNTWPESHHGPVIDYLAKCSGDCSEADKESLEFFKVDAAGLVDASSNKWGDDELIANNFTWTMEIPSDIADGQYVLRHEIIALHSAGQENGAQNYPQCINLDVSGGGSANPEGVKGTALYKPDDAGIKVSIYGDVSDYQVPGPAPYKGGSGSSSGSGSSAAASSAAPTSSAAAATSSAAVTTSASSNNAAVTGTASSGSSSSSSAQKPSKSLPEGFSMDDLLEWVDYLLQTGAQSSSISARAARIHARDFVARN